MVGRSALAGRWGTQALSPTGSGVRRRLCSGYRAEAPRPQGYRWLELPFSFVVDVRAASHHSRPGSPAGDPGPRHFGDGPLDHVGGSFDEGETGRSAAQLERRRGQKDKPSRGWSTEVDDSDNAAVPTPAAWPRRIRWRC